MKGHFYATFRVACVLAIFLTVGVTTVSWAQTWDYGTLSPFSSRYKEVEMCFFSKHPDTKSPESVGGIQQKVDAIGVIEDNTYKVQVKTSTAEMVSPREILITDKGYRFFKVSLDPCQVVQMR